MDNTITGINNMTDANNIEEINDNICCITENSDNALFNFIYWTHMMQVLQ